MHVATRHSPVFAIIRLALHAFAVVVAVLNLPYPAWLARHGRRSVDKWIVLCIAAFCSILLNTYEAIRQRAMAVGTDIDKARVHPRLPRPSLGNYIGAHIVTLIFTLTGILVLLFSQWGVESPSWPRTTEEERLQDEDQRLNTVRLITGSLACILQLLFSIFTCFDYHRMRQQKKLEKAARRGARRPQPAGNGL